MGDPQLAQGSGAHLILYDGVCGLCSRLNQFVLDRDRRRLFDFASQQSVVGRQYLERFGQDSRALSTLFVVSNYRTPAPGLNVRAGAALFVLREMGGAWRRVALAAAHLPGGWLDALYNLVARYRYRLFGRHDECAVPAADVRRRFLDV